MREIKQSVLEWELEVALFFKAVNLATALDLESVFKSSELTWHNHELLPQMSSFQLAQFVVRQSVLRSWRAYSG